MTKLGVSTPTFAYGYKLDPFEKTNITNWSSWEEKTDENQVSSTCPYLFTSEENVSKILGVLFGHFWAPERERRDKNILLAANSSFERPLWEKVTRAQTLVNDFVGTSVENVKRWAKHLLGGLTPLSHQAREVTRVRCHGARRE